MTVATGTKIERQKTYHKAQSVYAFLFLSIILQKIVHVTTDSKALILVEIYLGFKKRSYSPAIEPRIVSVNPHLSFPAMFLPCTTNLPTLPIEVWERVIHWFVVC